jgi:hypothetical protein
VDCACVVSCCFLLISVAAYFEHGYHVQIRKVLELMEEYGGPSALRYLKTAIPLCKYRIGPAPDVICIGVTGDVVPCHRTPDESCLQRKDAHAVRRQQEETEARSKMDRK